MSKPLVLSAQKLNGSLERATEMLHESRETAAVRAEPRIRRYVRFNRKMVEGWFGRTDAEIFSVLMLDQNRRSIDGGMLEIGIHHGRSFILMSLCASAGQSAVAVDVFEQQHLNLDHSGRGDLVKFVANLRRYGNADRTVILKASSLDLRPSAIHEHADDLRFVSIDGGHWHEAVLNDLRLAANCAAPQCVIAIDDFFNADYPNVAAAFYQWLDEKPDFAPFAASRGKLYLCRRGEGSAYQEALLSSRYLRWQLKKEATFLGVKVLQFTGLPSGWRGRAKKYLETYAPAVLDSLARRGLARRN